ncbi:MAG TPA: response regulator transcription factor [Salinivirgaceae bacterium]|nr:response regulator transcription factor [Salinivirgaceae bacterium]
MEGYKVAIVDDHQLFREGLKILLEGIPTISQVLDFQSGREFLQMLDKVLPDLVFMDIQMPDLDGISTTTLALQKYPDIKIIALSMYSDENYYSAMINAGAKGFIVKSAGFNEVETAIKVVSEGSHFFSEEILTRMLKVVTKKNETTPISNLTEREEEILLYICQGMSNQEIADILSISKRTVDKHRENILNKTNTRNTAGLVIYAIKTGIINI